MSERGCVRALGLAGVRGPDVTPAVSWPRPLLGDVPMAEARAEGPPPVWQAVWRSSAYTECVTGARGSHSKTPIVTRA